MSLVVLDTDVASVLLRRRRAEPLAARLAGDVLALTFMTVELTKVREWPPRDGASPDQLAGRATCPP